MVVVLILGGCIAIPTGAAQAAWIKASENRVTATSKALGGIKSLRISGLNTRAFDVIRNLRTEELACSKKFRILIGANLILRELKQEATVQYHSILVFGN
jgi:ATP-binding cassette, subfamily C (CFTR/MRP), member 1